MRSTRTISLSAISSNLYLLSLKSRPKEKPGIFLLRRESSWRSWAENCDLFYWEEIRERNYLKEKPGRWVIFPDILYIEKKVENFYFHLNKINFSINDSSNLILDFFFHNQIYLTFSLNIFLARISSQLKHT